MRLPVGLASAGIFALLAAPALAQSSARDSQAISDLIDLTMPHLNASDVFGPHGPRAGSALSGATEDFASAKRDRAWRLKTFKHHASSTGGAEDVVRLTSTTTDARGRIVPSGSAVMDPTETQRFDLNYVRGWPSALRMNAGGYGLDLTPHAGVSVSSEGGRAAEAGAMVRFGKGLGDRVKNALGIANDGTRAFGSHWYLFAAASGKAMGANMLDPQDSLRNAVMGMNQGGFQRETQAGLGWREGQMQASLGYVHEHIKSRVFGMPGQGEDRLAFSVSFHPR